MINRLNKAKAIIIMFLVSVIALTAGLLLSSAPAKVNADEASFTMSQKVEARISTPSGLRFKAQFDSATKSAIDSASEFGFLIAPTSYFDGVNDDYHNKLADKISVAVDKDKIVEQKDGKFAATAVLYNIKESNWDKEFSAVAFYKDTNGYHYASNIPSASINTLINKSFFGKYGNAETRAQLFTYFNYGGNDVVDFTCNIGGEDVVVSVEPHPIRVASEQFDFISTLDYDGGDPAYSYILTEDIICYYTAGNKYIYDNNFAGNIDGDGHKITYFVNTTGSFMGLYREVSGEMKNLAIESTLTSKYGDNASFAHYFSGKIENVVFIYDLMTNTYANKYETSVSSGVVYSLTGNAVINDTLVFDKGKGIHKYLAVKGNADQTISNTVYIGASTNNGLPGHNGSSVWSWRKLPTSTDNATVINMENFYMYNTYKGALNGDGKVVDGFVYLPNRETADDTTNLPHSETENAAWSPATEVKAMEVLKNSDISISTYENEAINIKGFTISINDDTVLDLASKLFEEVNSVEEFMAAGASGADTTFKLMKDIVITDKYLDASTDIGYDSTYLFNSDLKGVIDGNGYTLTINSYTKEQFYDFGGLFKSVSGGIKNLNIVMNSSAQYNGKAVSILFYTLTGTIEDCIITYDTTGAGNWGYSAPIKEMGAKAEIKNTLINIIGNSYAGNNAFVEKAQPTSKITNVAIVSTNFGWASSNGYKLNMILPTTKCDINGLYLYRSYDNAVNGVADWVLNANKYADPNTPTNVKYTDDASTEVLYDRNQTAKLADVLGFEVEKVSIPVIKKDGATAVNGFIFKKPFDTTGVTVALDQNELTLNSKSAPVQLTASIAKNGEAITDTLALAWSSDDDSVVTVVNGLITVVGAGTATVTATFYGITASCVVTVEEYVVEVGTTAEFIEKITSGEKTTYKLTSDIVLSDTNLDAESTFQTPDATFSGLDFAGVLDGNGHTITLNIRTADRGTNWGLFPKVSGTIKNVNFVVNNSSYYGGSHYGILILELTGTIENCIINVQNSGHGGGYGYPSLIRTLGADAEIKNTLINLVSPSYIHHLIAENASATSKITNVAIVSETLGWAASGSKYTLATALPTTKCDVSGFYCFQGKASSFTGSWHYVLKEDVYATYETPNVSKESSTWGELYGTETKAIKDITGFDVSVEALTILTTSGSSTMSGFDFAPVVAE